MHHFPMRQRSDDGTSWPGTLPSVSPRISALERGDFDHRSSSAKTAASERACRISRSHFTRMQTIRAAADNVADVVGASKVAA